MNSKSPNKQTQTDSLNLAAVFGFLQVLVQFDDPLLILLLLDPSDLLQLAGPLVFQHLANTDNVKPRRSLMRWPSRRTSEPGIAIDKSKAFAN